MNTHDIELPPLPKPAMNEGDTALYAAFAGSQLTDYARAAIELYQRRIAELESQLEAIGAGGVSSQRITSPSRGETVAWPTHEFAIVVDRMYEGEGPSLAMWNGENYNFTDGDCCDREPDGSLDGYTAEWLTHHQLEQRLFSQQPAEPVKVPSVPEEVRDSMMDSRYLAGVTAGWNAAQDDDPNASLKKIHDGYVGYLKPLRDWQKEGRPTTPAQEPSDDDLHNLWSRSGGVMRTFARALLTRYGHPVEPEGWQLVPKEATQEMFYTCEHIFDHGNSGESPFEFFDRKYKDILEAAPKFGEEE